MAKVITDTQPRNQLIFAFLEGILFSISDACFKTPKKKKKIFKALVIWFLEIQPILPLGIHTMTLDKTLFLFFYCALPAKHGKGRIKMKVKPKLKVEKYSTLFVVS